MSESKNETKEEMDGGGELLLVEDLGLAKHVDATGQQGTNSPSSVIATLYPTTGGSTSLLDLYATLLSQAEIYCEWAEVEDELALQVRGKPHALSLFRSVYRIGLQQAMVLKALAYLVNDSHVEDSLRILAVYFCVPNVTEMTKLACVRLLVVLKSPLDAGWQVEEPFLRDTLAFIMQTNDWEFLEHSEKDLLYSLRELVCAVRRLECQGSSSGHADDSDHEHDGVAVFKPLSTANHLPGDSTTPYSGSETALRDYDRQQAAPPAASPPSQDPLQRLLGKKRSRQNLRELENKYKGQLEGSPRVSSFAVSSGASNDPLSAIPPTSALAGPMNSLSLGSLPLMKRIAAAIANIAPASATISHDDTIERSGDSSTSDTTISDVWNMQLSKLSEYEYTG